MESWTTNNGSKYEGKWEEDLKQGEGREFDVKTGHFYQGAFNLNKREGKGILYWLHKPNPKTSYCKHFLPKLHNIIHYINYLGMVFEGEFRGGQKIRGEENIAKQDKQVYFDIIDKFLKKKSKTDVQVKVYQ